MAAYSTGASWSFPADLPGAWAADNETSSQQQPESAYSSQRHDRSSSPARPATPPSDSAAPNEAPRKRRRTHFPPRQCRICLEVVHPTFPPAAAASSVLPPSMQSAPRPVYASPGDGGRLLSPCRCKGSQKYVHEECLGAWRRADPTQRRNYWECPTCGYRYRLERLTWGGWVGGAAAQLALTLAVFALAVFAAGFVADPLINLYLDPLDTLVSGGGARGESLLFDGERAGWTEHFAKGFAGLGLIGFAKLMLSMSLVNIYNLRGGGFWFGRGTTLLGGGGGTNRARAQQQINPLLILVGVATFLFAVWKGVRSWSRRTLNSASSRVMDVPGSEDDDDEEEAEEEAK